MANDDPFAALDAELEKKLPKIPGMALVVAKEGVPIYEKYAGYRDVERKLKVTSDTVFGVASITKSFAALGIMQLADAGKLSVHDPVTEWLPEFTLPKKTYTDQVSIHHLMSHTSGLPGLPAVHQARAASIKRDPDGAYLFSDIPNIHNKKITSVIDLMELMKELDFPLLGPPGSAFNYSNEGYALLQKIIERASGESFLAYMDAHILQPLQMNRSTFLTEDLKQMDRVTELYAFTQDAEQNVFHSPAWWDVGDIYSNGSLKASVADLIKYLEVYRLNGTVNGQRIVSEASVKQMTAPQATAPNGNKYGYGLQIHDQFDVPLVGHGGGIKGVSSNMLFSQEHGVSVAVLTNIANVAAEDLAVTAMKHVLGLKEKSVQGKDFDIPKEDPARFAGTYASLEGQKVTVTVENKQLYLVLDHNTIAIHPVDENKFRTEEGKKIVFMTNDDNEVVGIFTGLRYLPKVSPG